MSERTYKVASARAACNKIWQADFDLDSFNEIVDKAVPDTVVARVGMSDYSGPDRRISEEYETLDEWSVVRGNTQWTFTLKWRD